ncbi:peroxiredoxin [Candidatus Izimaplasma bacterium ZiA1]|uniref:peroxiredoxin n=1 Tax=Candidatus Izimoplasma sp. ZiA1 TaxID=2024899 RepID=UPI000BAA8B37|nr:peroxiredoxin [Candidatus Izimaplasma bacterium ZiA1]
MNYLDIEVTGSDDKLYKLRDYLGKRVVLYFYPKDNTSGCTLEAKDFTCLKDEFAELGYQVFGVSRDTVKSHQNFMKRQELDLILLSDVNEELVKEFDVLKEKSMYGKKYIGILRSTFILDEEGKIIKEWRKITAKDHAKNVLDYIKG